MDYLAPTAAETTISIVVPAHNEAEAIAEFNRRLSEVRGKLAERSEVIYVNDGSLDATLAVLRRLRESDPTIAIVSLSRNFGKEIALTAGSDGRERFLFCRRKNFLRDGYTRRLCIGVAAAGLCGARNLFRVIYLLRRRDWRSCFCDLASLTRLLLREAYADSLWIREHGTRRASRSIRVWRGGKMGPGRIQGLTSPQRLPRPPRSPCITTEIAASQSANFLAPAAQGWGIRAPRDRKTAFRAGAVITS